MKKRLLQLLVTALVLFAIFGCGAIPPGTSAKSHSMPPASPTPCQPLPAEQGLHPTSNIPDTGPGSEVLPHQAFLTSIQSTTPPSTFCPAIQNGLAFLKERYNPTLGLLNEAPTVAPHTYWLTNDNALAAYAFARLGQAEMSAALTQSILRYGSSTNGLIEVVWGVPVTFPPHVATPIVLQEIGQDKICQEDHDRGPTMNDWAQYANLGFLGALSDFYQGNLTKALSVYAATLEQFDGTGFADLAFSDGRYETYKLALALYVGAALHTPNPDREQMLSTLLSMQAASNGGFFTHYLNPQTPEGDTNTETTALALLALAASGCGP